jgi:FkbH-like protein
MLPIELPPSSANLTRADYLRLAKELAALEPVENTKRVAVLASFTTDFFKPCLIVEAARKNQRLEVWLAPYGQIEQQALDPQSSLHKQKPDVILILPQLDQLAPELSFRFLAHTPAALEKFRDQLTARLSEVLWGIRSGSKAKILMGNFTPPLWNAAGLAESSLETSQARFIQDLNGQLTKICSTFPDALILDVHRAATEVGLDHWRDERLEFLAKSPWSSEAMSKVAKASARRLHSWFSTPSKCLVLDMDNTLWGGVLGEAGIDGIALGPDYPGNVFVDFQKRILALRDTGILLAAASKNNAADVEDVLTNHPSCLLKREHFSAFEVHWEDKATSLRRIATSLNIGLDSLVFFDDNPAERAWVKEQLPEVTVLDVSTNILSYSSTLADCDCFDLTSLTTEDLSRSQLYAEDLQRRELQTQTGSLEDFLRGLDMTLTFGQADEQSLPRIVQLLGKTNQFNLTTRRHNAAELQAMLDAGGIILWAKLRDRFGDNGLIAVGIVLPEDAVTWRLDSFLMSCRVIGRGVETALLAALANAAKNRGAQSLIGEFIPTQKNFVIADFLPANGFSMQPDTNLYYLKMLDEDFVSPGYFKVECVN